MIKHFREVLDKGHENALNKKQYKSLATVVGRVGDPEFLQDIFQQTPPGQRGLQQVGPNKRGKPQPVDVNIYGQNKADEHKTARYTSNDSISHFF
ncbi:MAG: hypothetical protein Tsb004_28530 [Allomuricauda sp.]